MDIHIDPHAIATVVAFVLIVCLCVGWALLSRRVLGLLVVVGLGLTILTASRSDLSLVHMESIGITGAILTLLVACAYGLLRSWLRSRRYRPGRVARQQRAVEFAQREPLPARAHQTYRVVRQPEPVYEDEEPETDELPTPEVEAREYRDQRRPVARSHQAGQRARSYAGVQRRSSAARGARLQQR